MKIKNYRLFLLGFVTVSFVFLTGFQKSGGTNASLAEKQAASVEVKKDQIDSKESFTKLKQKKIKNRHLVPNTNEDTELQKSLDLSIQFKDSENTWLTTEQNRIVSGESVNMFFAEKKKKLRPVDLDSQMLMSQEPEVDKRKSFDGAGIVITLKR